MVSVPLERTPDEKKNNVSVVSPPFPLWIFAEQLQDLLSDSSIFGNLDNLCVDANDRWAPHASKQGCRTEIQDGNWFQNCIPESRKNNNHTKDSFYFGIEIYTDKTGKGQLNPYTRRVQQPKRGRSMVKKIPKPVGCETATASLTSFWKASLMPSPVLQWFAFIWGTSSSMCGRSPSWWLSLGTVCQTTTLPAGSKAGVSHPFGSAVPVSAAPTVPRRSGFNAPTFASVSLNA